MPRVHAAEDGCVQFCEMTRMLRLETDNGRHSSHFVRNASAVALQAVHLRRTATAEVKADPGESVTSTSPPRGAVTASTTLQEVLSGDAALAQKMDSSTREVSQSRLWAPFFLIAKPIARQTVTNGSTFLVQVRVKRSWQSCRRWACRRVANPPALCMTR